ncbi:MAG: hypothetical protein ABFD44_03430, partial [Anaerolineaceae bacterium]
MADRKRSTARPNNTKSTPAAKRTSPSTRSVKSASPAPRAKDPAKAGKPRQPRASSAHPSKSRPVQSLHLSPERKLDLLGTFLALIGLLTLLSLLSARRGSLTGWWVGALSQGVGWGMFVLPLGLLGV